LTPSESCEMKIRGLAVFGLMVQIFMPCTNVRGFQSVYTCIFHISDSRASQKVLRNLRKKVENPPKKTGTVQCDCTRYQVLSRHKVRRSHPHRHFIPSAKTADRTHSPRIIESEPHCQLYKIAGTANQPSIYLSS